MYSCKEVSKERKDYMQINLYARHNNIIIDFGTKKQPKAWRTIYIYMITLIYIEHWYLLATNIILHIDKHKIIFSFILCIYVLAIIVNALTQRLNFVGISTKY